MKKRVPQIAKNKHPRSLTTEYLAATINGPIESYQLTNDDRSGEALRIIKKIDGVLFFQSDNGDFFVDWDTGTDTRKFKSSELLGYIVYRQRHRVSREFAARLFLSVAVPPEFADLICIKKSP